MPDFNVTLHHKEVHKIERGRYIHFEVTLNSDGSFFGVFTVENMQALAGYHGQGHLDFCDGQSNIIGRLVMPRLGVNAAGFSRHVKRVHHFGGALAAEYVGRVVTLRSSGYENASSTVSVAEILTIFRELKRG